MHERSLSLVMHDAKDHAREALRIPRAHYTGSGKPRIISLYNQLTTLKKSHSESISDYIIWAENTVTALNAADRAVNDSLLVVIVLKGLPEDYTTFVAVITQQENTLELTLKTKELFVILVVFQSIKHLNVKKGREFCNFCKSSSRNNKTCHKSKDCL